ncbi:CPBP family intramembrane metalloprotease [candidate division KSB1 bacterium]|nr:CPBP family intramembrane metalloprotease [candidate division KSB1 bacterium]
MEDLNKNGLFSPIQIFILFLVTIALVTVTGVIIILLGGSTLSLLTEILIVLPALIACLQFKMPFTKTFRLHKINLPIIFYSIVISLAVFIIGDEIDRIIYLIFPMPEELYESMIRLLQIDSVKDAVILIMSGVIFAAFAEEMLFRGVLQKSLEHFREPATAIVLSSVFFAIIHFNPWAALQIMILGLFLGYMAWRANSIFPAIILHGINNLLSMILMNLPEEKLKWYSETTIHVNVYLIVFAIVVLVPAIVSFNRACDEK